MTRNGTATVSLGSLLQFNRLRYSAIFPNSQSLIFLCFLYSQCSTLYPHEQATNTNNQTEHGNLFVVPKYLSVQRTILRKTSQLITSKEILYSKQIQPQNSQKKRPHKLALLSSNAQLSVHVLRSDSGDNATLNFTPARTAEPM